MEFIAILCLNYNNAIGCKSTNDLIFNIKNDMQYFKNITTTTRENMKNVLVMGRNTWDSIKYKPLKNRMNFIISSNYETINYEYKKYDNVIAFPNNECCLDFINDNKIYYDKIFIIGGISIYEYYLNNNIINKIICTKITNKNNFGDIFFNVNYLNFFKICNIKEFINESAYNNVLNENCLVNYIICEYLKFSKINAELVKNIDLLHNNFNDNEETDSSDSSDTDNNDTLIENNSFSFYLSSSDSSSDSLEERNKNIEIQTKNIKDTNEIRDKMIESDSWTIINDSDFDYKINKYIHYNFSLNNILQIENVNDNENIIDNDESSDDKPYYF